MLIWSALRNLQLVTGRLDQVSVAGCNVHCGNYTSSRLLELSNCSLLTQLSVTVMSTYELFVGYLLGSLPYGSSRVPVVV